MRSSAGKKFHIALFLGCLAFMAVALFLILGASITYQELYGTPRVSGGKMDFSMLTPEDTRRKIGFNLGGDWEFFYNRWLITDGDAGGADTTVRLPGRWTGVKTELRLPKSGYGSYRLVVDNLAPTETLSVKCNNVAKVAYRTFINGVLNCESGTMSKDTHETFATGCVDTRGYYRHDGGQVVIVVEVAANNQGGLTAPLWLDVVTDIQPAHEWQQYTLPNYLFGGMIVAILFCFLLPARTLKRNNALPLLLFLTMLLLHYAVGVDVFKFTFNFLSLSAVHLPLVRYITGALAALAFVLRLLLDRSITLSRRTKLGLLALNACAAAAFFALMGTVYQILPIAVSLTSLIFILYKLAFSQGKKWPVCVNAFAGTVLILLFAIETLDAQSLIVYTSEVLGSIGVILTILFVAFLNFYKARESQMALVRAARTDTEIANMKKQSLKAQIKPHFIFNSLNAIKELYRRDADEGEEMLALFAAHLRANVDSDEKDLIPFEDELNNMLNYFELENLRNNGRLTLLLNIDYADFSVPVLSLQPFLENAVKYAGTQALAGGWIQISSALMPDGSVGIEVADNGCGFEPNAVREGAVGIKNATQRLQYGLQAAVAVRSVVGGGTTVTITVPKAFVFTAARTVTGETV